MYNLQVLVLLAKFIGVSCQVLDLTILTFGMEEDKLILRNSFWKSSGEHLFVANLHENLVPFRDSSEAILATSFSFFGKTYPLFSLLGIFFQETKPRFADVQVHS